MTAFVANANMLVLSGLTSIVEGLLDNATVQVSIKNSGGEVQTGDGWPTFPVTMEPVSSVPGDYVYTFAADVPWVANKSYAAVIVVPGAAEWDFIFKPIIRR